MKCIYWRENGEHKCRPANNGGERIPCPDGANPHCDIKISRDALVYKRALKSAVAELLMNIDCHSCPVRCENKKISFAKCVKLLSDRYLRRAKLLMLLTIIAMSCACANSQLIRERERNKNLQEIINSMPLEKRNLDGEITP